MAQRVGAVKAGRLPELVLKVDLGYQSRICFKNPKRSCASDGRCQTFISEPFGPAARAVWPGGAVSRRGHLVQDCLRGRFLQTSCRQIHMEGWETTARMESRDAQKGVTYDGIN